ncbi:tripartite motif-containing protein 16 [Chanos chanos]|uniref:Tripartite motif-containing protein 16 n=1 Tax=Chanos chanos TaxID=29144 RepID=A0A6J2WJV1_CHACN|nr:tripartite motif-containing protein 16-like [Chanos chanos]
MAVSKDDLKDFKVSEEPTDPQEDSSPVPGDQGPEEVLCDSCIESPSKAIKSCLTCQVSYCEAHLRPHLENSKFQTHRLVEPLQDMEVRICDHHRLPLGLFCLTDSRCVCLGCQEEDHRGHPTVTAGNARKQIEEELQRKHREMVKTMSSAEHAISKLQSNTASIEASVVDVRAVIEKQFSELQAAMENARKEALDVLEVEHRQALSQAEGIRAHLERKITELKKILTQVERLSVTKNDMDFIQEYSEWKKAPVDVGLPGVYISLIDHLSTFSRFVTESAQELCDQLFSKYNIQLKELYETEKLSIKMMVHSKAATNHHVIEPEPETREDFLKYASILSFNPDSTHKFLRLTDNNKKVTNTTPWQHSYPDTAERFEYWRQVLALESLYLGRHYFEVDLSGDGAYVGLTYKSIDRKGDKSSSCITGNSFSWCLGREGRGLSTWHADVEIPLEVGEFTRIGVYVDYEKGVLTFYGVATPMVLLYQYTTNFLEPLYPAFWLSKKDNVVALVIPGDD